MSNGEVDHGLRRDDDQRRAFAQGRRISRARRGIIASGWRKTHRMEARMKRLARVLLCLMALVALAECTNTYDDFVYPGKLFDPGTQ